MILLFKQHASNCASVLRFGRAQCSKEIAKMPYQHVPVEIKPMLVRIPTDLPSDISETLYVLHNVNRALMADLKCVKNPFVQIACWR